MNWLTLTMLLAIGILGFAYAEEAAVDEFMAYGKYTILHTLELDLKDMKSTEKDSKDGAIGQVEITEKTVKCPLATFDFVAIRKHPVAPGWGLKVMAGSKVISCWIVQGRSGGLALDMETEDRKVTYKLGPASPLKEK